MVTYRYIQREAQNQSGPSSPETIVGLTIIGTNSFVFKIMDQIRCHTQTFKE